MIRSFENVVNSSKQYSGDRDVHNAFRDWNSTCEFQDYFSYESHKERTEPAVALRACLVSSENDVDKSKRNHLKRILKESLTIFSKPAAFIKPAKGSFHNPTLWENSKSVKFAVSNYFDFRI